MTPKTYQDNFFSYHLQESLSSAKNIIPLILELVRPNSVIDIGCGIGTWLTIWKQYGVNDITGVDGNYVNTEELLIDKNNFIPFNLEEGFKASRRFDLATCLEVAEHISDNSAQTLINSLCDLSDIILFSAAVPGQEGTSHINEQYPEYWMSYFIKNDFLPIDCIRSRVWANKNISWWYRQNIMLYAKRSVIEENSKLKKAQSETKTDFMRLIHPEIFEYKLNKISKYEEEIAMYKNNIAAYEKLLSSPIDTLKYSLRKYLERRNKSNNR